MNSNAGREKIYTIKINEAMREGCGCPLCTVQQRLEASEIERIIGASMMEPDVRERTNILGFCNKHLEELLSAGNRLSLALVLHTHLTELARRLYVKSKPPLSKTPSMQKQAEVLSKARRSCYLCERINNFMNGSIKIFVYLYKTDEQFRQSLNDQQYFCIKHTHKLIEQSKTQLPRAAAAEFANLLSEINLNYTTELIGDMDWFCKKFDYRNKEADWKNSKDAIERTVKLLNK